MTRRHPPLPSIDGIRLVCLDAAGTLFHLRGPLGDLYAERARAHGLPAREGLAALLERRFRREFGGMPRPAYRAGDREHNDRVDRDWWRILVQRVFAGLGPMDFEAFFNDVYALFADAVVWQVYPEVPEVLTELRRADLGLAIVSNFDARLSAVCEGLGLLPAFDLVLTAAEAGMAKPGRGIFHAAARRFGVSPEQAVHVGDSWTEDAMGARGAGLAAVHLQRQGHEAPAGRSPEVPVIADLAELPGLLVRQR